MSGSEVPQRKTPANLDDLVSGFIKAWRKLEGRDPSKQQIAMVMSQNALETGGFATKSMLNYNIGNIIKTPYDNFDYYVHPDSYHGKKIIQHFRSYNSLQEGIEDFLKLIKKGYPQAFSATTKTPKEYAYALVENPKARYYDETHRDDYAKGMNSLYNQYLKSKDFNRLFDSIVGLPAENTIEKAPEAKEDDGFLSSLIRKIEEFIMSIALLKNKDMIKNSYVILVNSNNKENSVEFARILSMAIREELKENADIHFDGDNVEIQVNASKNGDVKGALSQLSDAISEAFIEATKKIGGVKVNSYIMENQISKYAKIEDEILDKYYRQFHIKFLRDEK